MIHVAATAALLAAVAAAWVLLAPTSLGGKVTYIITQGNSMEPRLHANDLVLVRRSGRYAVGDVVAYGSKTLGQPVLHRIVAIDGRRLTLKGDGNDWLDGERPMHDAVLGKVWAVVPQGGRVILLLRRLGVPLAVAAAVAAASTRRRRRGAPATALQTHRRPDATSLDGARIAAAAGAGLVAFASLTVFAARAPAAPSMTDHGYTHRGRFTYNADVPKSEVYPNAEIDKGEPVFLRLVDAIETGFEYSLDTTAVVDPHGSARMFLRVADPNGWNRSFPVGRPVEFRGKQVRLGGTVDLVSLRALLDRVADRTGIASPVYGVTLLPTVEVSGTLAGRPLTDTFTPRLDMTMDTMMLKLAPSSQGRDGADPLAVASGTAREPGEVGAVPEILGMPVPAARWVGIIGTLLSAVALVLWALYPKAGTSSLGSEHISAWHRRRLIEVTRIDRGPSHPRASVASFDELAAVAARYDAPILHHEAGGADLYAVEAGGMSYEYQTAPPAPIRPTGKRPSLRTATKVSRAATSPGQNSTLRGRAVAKSERVVAGDGQKKP